MTTVIFLPLQIVYLRRFKQLQTLNLSGNPICEQEDYKPYLIAHMPVLEYLDYRLIDEAAVIYHLLSDYFLYLRKFCRCILWSTDPDRGFFSPWSEEKIKGKNLLGGCRLFHILMIL